MKNSYIQQTSMRKNNSSLTGPKFRGVWRKVCTVGGHKLDPLAINSTTAVAAEARETQLYLPQEWVEFMAKWFNLYPRTVLY